MGAEVITRDPGGADESAAPFKHGKTGPDHAAGAPDRVSAAFKGSKSPMNQAATAFDDTAAAGLVRAFEAGALDPAAFHHVDHVKLTWTLLRDLPLEETIDKLREGLKRLAASVGRSDRYHETITVFYATQIHHRMMPDEPWETFAARNGDLIGLPKEFLGRHYHEATLSSDRARLEFVEPDRG